MINYNKLDQYNNAFIIPRRIEDMDSADIDYSAAGR